MTVVTLDFETFYSTEYSLTRMSEIDYVLDPRFQCIMAAIKVDGGPSEAHVGYQAVARRLNSFDWNTTSLCSHNMRFDGSIAAWHFGISPALYLDTLGMARALTHSRVGKSSLDAVSKYLGLPEKGHYVHDARGKRLEDFTPDELQNYIAYCLRDNENCYEILQAFLSKIPRSELRFMDTLIRMFIEPQVKLNPHALAEHLAIVRAEKAQVMAKVAHIDKSVFSSQQKFQALLEGYGVEVPMKQSPTVPGKMVPALAKNDRAFKEMCEDGDLPMEIQALLMARMSVKSTIEETRGEALLNLSMRNWGPEGTGWAPVPLKYFGAHTGRVSGDGGFNWLNFKRGSKIRDGIEAPEGYRIVHRDSSQIEARMVAYLAGCETLLEAFRDPERDPYCEFASIIYRKLVTKADKLERFVGKTGILGLGYGCGPPKFRHMLFIGNGGVSVSIDDRESGRIVYAYRGKYEEIPKLWQKGDLAIMRMMMLAKPATAGNMPHRYRAMEDRRIPIIELGPEAVWLPNNMCIDYPELEERQAFNPMGQTYNEISYSNGHGGLKKLYGAKFIENISQGLTRVIITDTADRVRQQTGYHPFLHTYDSLDYCVPERDAGAMDELLQREFAVVPDWAPGLPLASDGGWGRTLLIAESDKHPEHNR